MAKLAQLLGVAGVGDDVGAGVVESDRDGTTEAAGGSRYQALVPASSDVVISGPPRSGRCFYERRVLTLECLGGTAAPALGHGR